MYKWTITADHRVVMSGIAHFPWRGSFRVLKSTIPERTPQAFNRIIEENKIPWSAVDGHPEFLVGGDRKYEMHITPY